MSSNEAVPGNVVRLILNDGNEVRGVLQGEALIYPEGAGLILATGEGPQDATVVPLLYIVEITT